MFARVNRPKRFFIVVTGLLLVAGLAGYGLYSTRPGAGVVPIEVAAVELGANSRGYFHSADSVLVEAVYQEFRIGAAASQPLREHGRYKVHFRTGNSRLELLVPYGEDGMPARDFPNFKRLLKTRRLPGFTEEDLLARRRPEVEWFAASGYMNTDAFTSSNFPALRNLAARIWPR